MAGHQHPLLLYDGHCALCNAWVRILLALDRRGELRFSALHTPTAQRLLRQGGIKADSLESVVFIEGCVVDSGEQLMANDDTRFHFKSDAVFAAIGRVGSPVSYLRYGRYYPRFLRDRLYDTIATNRYAWFGRHESCPLPAAEHRDRFLDVD